MVIECSSCHARFKLADDKIKENGTKVRCTKCREVFTVFPESSPPVAPPAAPSIITVAPVAPVDNGPPEVEEDFFFSEPATPTFAAEKISSTQNVDFPFQEEDDWNQEAATDPFSEGFAGDNSDTDLDSINFDNAEAPVFSVSKENEENFDFDDELAFSFSNSPLGIAPEETLLKTSDKDDTQSLPGESDSDFNFTSTPAPRMAATEDRNPFDADGEFTFSGGESLDDLSWDEPASAPITPPPSGPTLGAEVPAEDKSFDFNSFSFDEVEASAEVGGKIDEGEVVVQNNATIELSTANSSPMPVAAKSPEKEESLSLPLAGERKEYTPRAASRALRPRVRPKKKRFGRLIVKIITVILLFLAATYGFMYRDQIEKTYSHLINRFIEKQTRVETNGTIGLVKLSGNYVLNSLEGDLFVIHGEVVNEFKGLRSSVMVKGIIFGDNGVVLRSQSVYCGNPLKESSLKSLSLKEIRNAMSNELGENLVNLNIAPGKSIPFTIVFDKAPKNIKEFSVEVLESKPGSK